MFGRRNRSSSPIFLGNPAPQNLVNSVAYAPDFEAETNQELVELALAAIAAASSVSFDWLKPLNSWHSLLEVFPGEHYRLLAGLMEVCKAEQICEIGTFKGLGSLALWAGDSKRRVTTYDILSLTELDPIIPKFILDAGSIVPRVADLSDPLIFAEENRLIASSQVIFLDGPKDGTFEYAFLKLLSNTYFEKPCLLIIDDIRFLNMIPLWRSIRSPKLDLTSFGHWSGTGVVRIEGSLQVNQNSTHPKTNVQI